MKTGKKEQTEETPFSRFAVLAKRIVSVKKSDLPTGKSQPSSQGKNPDIP